VTRERRLERRAARRVGDEAVVVPRVTDIYAALPAITGKIELEYEGELKGASTVVARDLIRNAVSNVFDRLLRLARTCG
jgi:magnesium chelatase subunit I